MHGFCGDTRQQEDQGFRDRGMRENCIAQHRERQPAEHCGLNGCHHFACFNAQRRESQDAVASLVNEDFHKAPSLAKSDSAQHSGHRQLGQAISDAPAFRFRFIQPDSREFGIREHAERHEPVARGTVASVQVVADHPEIGEGDVRELRAARDLADRPDAGRGTLHEIQSLSALPDGFTGHNEAAEIAIGRCGKFLCTSNRGDDSIIVFAIDPVRHTPKLVAHVPTLGKTLRNFAIDPTGTYLLAADQDSDNIVVFKIDQKTGIPVPTGQVVQVPSPVCIVFRPALAAALS